MFQIATMHGTQSSHTVQIYPHGVIQIANQRKHNSFEVSAITFTKNACPYFHISSYFQIFFITLTTFYNFFYINILRYTEGKYID